jgi:cytochrome c biogenesis protein CcdA
VCELYVVRKRSSLFATRKPYSYMLPAYFASSFQNRLRLVAMTFLFAAGVATIILPIALGASVLRQLFAAQHTTIYVVGGVLLLGLAIYLLLDGQIHLPMPGRSAGTIRPACCAKQAKRRYSTGVSGTSHPAIIT